MDSNNKVTNQVKMKQAIELLKIQGLNEQQVNQFILSLNNILAEQLQRRLLMALTKEEIEEIDKLPDEKIQNELIKRFEKNTRGSLADMSEEILAIFLDSFLSKEEAKNDRSS